METSQFSTLSKAHSIQSAHHRLHTVCNLTVKFRAICKEGVADDCLLNARPGSLAVDTNDTGWDQRLNEKISKQSPNHIN